MESREQNNNNVAAVDGEGGARAQSVRERSAGVREKRRLEERERREKERGERERGERERRERGEMLMLLYRCVLKL